MALNMLRNETQKTGIAIKRQTCGGDSSDLLKGRPYLSFDPTQLPCGEATRDILTGGTGSDFLLFRSVKDRADKLSSLESAAAIKNLV